MRFFNCYYFDCMCRIACVQIQIHLRSHGCLWLCERGLFSWMKHFLFHLSLGTMSPSAALRLATWQHFCFGLRTINRRTLHINTANWPIHYLAFMTRILNCQPFSVTWLTLLDRSSFLFFSKMFQNPFRAHILKQFLFLHWRTTSDVGCLLANSA